MIRLRYLFYLDRAEEGSKSISSMARVFGVSKSTISRNLDVFAENGILHSGTLNLTGLGRQLAKDYGEEVNGLRSYLSGMTVRPPEDMTAEAMQLLLALSDKTRHSILEKQKMGEFIRTLDERQNPKLEEIQDRLFDGIYHLPFTIYKENMENLKRGYVSMADMGFTHPAKLIVESGAGLICIKAVAMEKRSFMEDLLIRGKLIRMKYLSGKEYLDARQEGDHFYFPLSSLTFTFHKSEGLLQGSTKLLLESPMKSKRSHTRAAVFTLFLQ